MAKNKEENLKEVEVAVLDNEGNPVYNEDGSPKTEIAEVVVTEDTPKNQAGVSVYELPLEDIEKIELEKMLPFYTSDPTAREVHILRCEECQGVLGLEVLYANNEVAKHIHSEGRVIIPVGKRLQASRARIDGVMGYECLCGADTRVSSPEEGVLPRGFGSQLAPHEEAEIRNRIIKDKYKPDIKVDGNKKTIDNKFSTERVK